MNVKGALVAGITVIVVMAIVYRVEPLRKAVTGV